MDRLDEIRERLNGYTGLILAMPKIQPMYEDALLLLAEVERLEEECSSFELFKKMFYEKAEQQLADIKRLEAENAALKKQYFALDKIHESTLKTEKLLHNKVSELRRENSAAAEACGAVNAINAALRRERDAAIADARTAGNPCDYCAKSKQFMNAIPPYYGCKNHDNGHGCPDWKWRGVESEA